MKKFFFTLTLAIAGATQLFAMSEREIRENARFLSDRMAYELNLTPEQYDDCYEINYDFIASIDPVLDDVAYGYQDAIDRYYDYLDWRNEDLRIVMAASQFARFCTLEYFVRPVYTLSRRWRFRIYDIYSNWNHFYFGLPHVYHTYHGAHSRIHHVHGFYGGRYHHEVAHHYDHYRGSHRYNDVHRHDFGSHRYDRGHVRHDAPHSYRHNDRHHDSRPSARPQQHHESRPQQHHESRSNITRAVRRVVATRLVRSSITRAVRREMPTAPAPRVTTRPAVTKRAHSVRPAHVVEMVAVRTVVEVAPAAIAVDNRSKKLLYL